MLFTILIIILILMLLGGAPQFGVHSYGWYPSGGIGFILLIVVIVLLLR